jgi:hypothetical protein
MKTAILSFIIIISAGFFSCQKNDMMNNISDVDINRYNNQLKGDYNNALINHNLLTSANNENNASVYRTLFHISDSLFSGHFYEFCIDMMQNSGMMSGSNGIMGTNYGMMSGNSGMMGGNMMNGVGMGSNVDMNKMMSYMDSLHNSNRTAINPDYFETDSLMFSQMDLCKMMIAHTDSVTTIFNKMQLLRKNHFNIHDN